MSEGTGEALNNVITIFVMLTLLGLALSVIGYVFMGGGTGVTTDLTDPENASMLAKFFMGVRGVFVPTV